MSLKQCKECGNAVSNKAKTCPHCGARVKKLRWSVVMLSVLIIVACVISLSTMVGRNTTFSRHNKFESKEDVKAMVEKTIKEGLLEDYNIRCVSTELLEGADGNFSGTAKLEDGRLIEIHDAGIDGEMIRWKHRIKQGYEYKCKHHITNLKLITSPEDAEQGIIFGEIWNDGYEPIRGFVVAEFLDNRGNINQRCRITITFPPNGKEIFDWIPPNKGIQFKYPLTSEILEGNLKNIRAEFFDLGDEAIASISCELFDEDVLISIPIKVTSKIYKLEKEQATPEFWEKIQEEFDDYNIERILTNMFNMP